MKNIYAIVIIGLLAVAAAVYYYIGRENQTCSDAEKCPYGGYWDGSTCQIVAEGGLSAEQIWHNLPAIEGRGSSWHSSPQGSTSKYFYSPMCYEPGKLPPHG